MAYQSNWCNAYVLNTDLLVFFAKAMFSFNKGEKKHRT